MQFLLRRMGFYLMAGFVALTLNFLIPRMMVGSPADIIMARFQGRLDPRALNAMKEAFGFVDGPITQQYMTYLQSLAQGNLGTSVAAFPLPVAGVIGTALGWTLGLVGLATLISFALGLLMGIWSAWRRGKFLDTRMLPLLSVMGAFPIFFVALFFLYAFGMNLHWFPINHSYDITMQEDWQNPEFIVSVIQHSVLPAAAIFITSLGGWMLGMRNNMINVLGQDYIVMAQAKGLADKRVMYIYAARNAILPSLTAFAMNLGFVIGGALLVEVVFSYPGMGFLLLSAVNNRDYPLMQGIFLLITIAVLTANFIIDIIYVLLDPRAR